ncbi:hypothetical protein MML48_6g00008261 [Holotrichia oblita]|uniref:Uncharacterized protein n=1 Tax=Holotrichia oblita TaxID=644536 RepID=A0ACB9SY79_HOLOL|nr:hypothetical protein MML48_6g00008261 [Holotrichia oblita]
MSALYRTTISALDKIVPSKLQPLWQHPAGKSSNHLLHMIHNLPINIVLVYVEQSEVTHAEMCSFGNKKEYSEHGVPPFSNNVVRCNTERDGLPISNKMFGCHTGRGGLWHHLKYGFPGYDLLSLLIKRQAAQSPKTVFFWAPAFKWGLVIAGISDLRRPVDQLSIAQSASLAATGVIWSRYSLVIIPKNYGLFSVNVFVAMTQLYQLYRAIR